jgi:hypothetical protein
MRVILLAPAVKANHLNGRRREKRVGGGGKELSEEYPSTLDPFKKRAL